MWGPRGLVFPRKLVLGALVSCGAAFAQEAEKLAPYYPTPLTIVEKMLDLGGLKAGEKMFDLGSGDGRIVIMAAQKYHADATGVEMVDDLYRQSMQKIRTLGLDKTARIIHGDSSKQDYGSANLLTIYLLPASNDKVRPLLEKQPQVPAKTAWLCATKYRAEMAHGATTEVPQCRRW